MFLISACLLLSTSLWTSAAYINGSLIIDEKKCTEIHTSGYGYKNWYTVDQSSSTGVEGDVLLKFYVQSKDNAHVLLSNGPSTPAYEIVIGAGSNTYSVIRKSKGAKNEYHSYMSQNTTDILNTSYLVGFWIRISRNSELIEVGKVGENFPFIYWMDSKPVPVKYFSFSSWGESIARWLLKCKFDVPETASNKSAPREPLHNTDYITKFLTSTERLRKDVLKQRNFGIGDSVSNTQELLIVSITGHFSFIHLDVMTSTLTLRGQAIFEWTDRGIQWDPQHYSNINKLHLSNYELWRPELVLHNALDPTASLFSESKISVDNTGKVVWNPKFDIITKCDIDLKSWPWDRHKCALTMSPWSHKLSNVVYEMATNAQSKCFPEAHSDWKLDNMTSYYVLNDPTPWDEIISSVSDEKYDVGDEFKQVSLQLVVDISRNTKLLEKLFYIPLLLISGLWLSSFCVMPNSSSKITIICTSIIFSTSILVYMTTYVPIFVELPPDLLLGYLKLMLMISTDAFVSSFLIAFHNRRTTSGHPPFLLTRFLTIPAMTRLLVLPKLEYTQADLEDYNRVVNDDGSERVRSTVTLWDVVVVAFERLMFIVYFVITVVVLSSVGIFAKS